MVAAARDVKRDTGIYGWPLSPLVRSFGLLLQQTLHLSARAPFYKVKVTGKEKLVGLRGPVMFAAEPLPALGQRDHPHGDPSFLRWKLAVAAAADDVFGNKLNGFASSILANAFPLAREGAIRRSLELLWCAARSAVLGAHLSEGKLTIGGPMQPFKSGTGLHRGRGATPVVPMKLKIGQGLGARP